MHEDYGRARTPTAGGRAARDSGCRGRLPLAVALVAIVGLVATLLMGGRAYADGEGGGGSHDFGNTSQTVWTAILYQSGFDNGSQYIVGAWNKYDAAAMICGKSMTEIQGFDLVVRGKLSTNGGKFQELAESLAECWPSWNDESLQQSLGDEFGSTIWNKMIGLDPTVSNPNKLTGWQIDYWANNCTTNIYAASVAPSLVSQATSDLNNILNGGNIGSGNQEFTKTLVLTNTYGVVKLDSGQYDSASNHPLTLNFQQTFVDLVQGNLTTYPYWAVVASYTSSKTVGNCYVLMATEPITVTAQQTGSNTNTGEEYYSYTVTGTNLKRIDWTNKSKVSAFEFNMSYGSSFSSVSGGTFSNNVSTSVYYITSSSAGGGGGGGGNDWPEPGPTPTPTPDPPEVPEPPVIQLPEPGDPVVDPQIPTEPTTNVQDPVNAPDYTLWLVAILAQLRTINDSLAQHCVHLQQEIWDNGTRVTNSIIARANSLESTLVDGNNAMMDYLYDLFHWLAERMNFDNSVYVEPYNDSSVLYWLKRIYSKLTNDAPDIRQPDTEEPFDFWAWLLQLVSDTIGGIIGDLVGDLAGLLEDFTDKFPFSIPWDIAALLALLDAQRATPVFVVTIPAVNGWWPQQNYTIDLTPYNGVASAARTMINIWWLLVLALKTDWMLLIMGDSASLGERFVRKISGGAA